MHIQHMINSKSEYRNTKQIQISNDQMIEEPRSKLREYARYPEHFMKLDENFFITLIYQQIAMILEANHYGTVHL